MRHLFNFLIFIPCLGWLFFEGGEEVRRTCFKLGIHSTVGPFAGDQNEEGCDAALSMLLLKGKYC